MIFFGIRLNRFFTATFCCCAFLFEISFAKAVAVHDPSIVIAYKDASGNSYPENDASKSREKFYYIFGTQLGAAYSKNMLDWTEFTPTFSVNGTLTTDYYEAFKAAAIWSGHTDSESVRGNLWAPDIIYNKSLKKWCLYFSINGDDWMSSVVLHTSDKIEGPYEYAGTVVYSGMDNESAGKAGNLDYQKVTGESSIDSRYFMANDGKTNLGKWDGGYGTSCIDPNVFYGEDGNLYLLYGSWSGGIFLIKLDEKTGLRDYGRSYGTAPVWNGTSLQSDPYMGIHIAGGYYVSGEGAYIQYFTDNDGKGFYYLFVSMGFYSPEGGYTMRVFRSENVEGPYSDPDGTPAIFSKYVFNYGSNVEYGFPIMQNYKWNFWDKGEVAQGHNSLLLDEDGKMYLVYHRKFDDGTVFHNVETHQLFFGKAGWPLAAPFEYRENYGKPKAKLTAADIAGTYGAIFHESVDYANLKSNLEKTLFLNADGSLGGDASGTWTYDFSNGNHYLALNTSNGTFRGVVLEQLANDRSFKTVTFTAMNEKGSLALWGYRKPKTEVLNAVYWNAGDNVVGKKDFSTAWNDYDSFRKENVSGNFIAEFEFTNYTEGKENWNNWILAFKNGNETWYLRSDAYSLETFSGSTVGYKGLGLDNVALFKELYKNRKVKLRIAKDSSNIQVFAFIESSAQKLDSLVYAVTAQNVPAGNYEIYLGVDANYLELTRSANGTEQERTLVGTIDDAGIYTAVFNTEASDLYKVSGNFSIRFDFMNYGNGQASENWDNYIVKAVSDKGTSLLRADAYAMDISGTISYDFDFSWDDFKEIMQNAKVSMDVSRKGSDLKYSATILAENGTEYHYSALNENAPESDMEIGFTCEKSAVDLLTVEVISDSSSAEQPAAVKKTKPESLLGNKEVFVRGKTLYVRANSAGFLDLHKLNGSRLGRFSHGIGETPVATLKPGIYFALGKKLTVMD